MELRTVTQTGSRMDTFNLPFPPPPGFHSTAVNPYRQEKENRKQEIWHNTLFRKKNKVLNLETQVYLTACFRE